MRKMCSLVPLAAALAMITACSAKTASPAARGDDGSSGIMTGITAAIDAKPGTDGAAIYSRTCGYCHGANVGPVLLGRDLPPDAIKMMARTGMGAMPAFRPTEINDEELDTLAQWISTSKADPREHGQ